MGPGHFGVALAAKPLAPKAPIWALLAASEILDLMCFGLMALRLEKAGTSQASLESGVRVLTVGVVPWSHGLLMSIVWSAVAGLLAFWWLHDRQAGMVLGLVVFSHWVLDFIVHPPDLPLLFMGSPLLGLGLYTSGPGLILSGILEFGLLGVGLYLYLRWRGLLKGKAVKQAG